MPPWRMLSVNSEVVRRMKEALKSTLCVLFIPAAYLIMRWAMEAGRRAGGVSYDTATVLDAMALLACLGLAAWVGGFIARTLSQGHGYIAPAAAIIVSGVTVLRVTRDPALGEYVGMLFAHWDIPIVLWCAVTCFAIGWTTAYHRSPGLSLWIPGLVVASASAGFLTVFRILEDAFVRIYCD